MIEEYTYKGHNIRIFESEVSDESPREYDPLGTMLTFHRNVNWTDHEAEGINPKDFEGWEELKQHLIKRHKAVVCLPIYLLDRSGHSISVKPFVGHSMDSGQLGFIYVTRQGMLKHQNFKRLTKKLIDEAEQQLIGEVETLDQWMRGEAYGFVIDPQEDDDEEGLHEEYGSAYYDVEEAKIVATDSVDRLRAMDEELEWIESMPSEELPKYINHKWKYPHVSTAAYKERLKCLNS
jgi:hypothetical protein